MNLKVLELLEFNKVKSEMYKYAKTETAKTLITNLKPFETIEEVNRSLEETGEAISFVKEFGRPDFSGLRDIVESIEKINKSGIITIKEIYRIGTTLKCLRNIKSYLSQKDIKHLKSYYDNIYTFKSLEDSILRAIKDGEEVTDQASENLFKIRRELRSKTAEVKRKLSDILKTYSKYLQDNVFTIRGDRYCIPVKAEYKSQVQGIVHNQSASGSTFFIEPLVLVNLNNEVNELIESEKEEIQRILRMLCMKIQDNFEYIEISIKNLYTVEFIFCKAYYGNEIEGIKPVVNDNENIYLLSARHPLLEREKVVPLTLDFSKDRKAIIITGPNTGGKTVTLKTLGLMHIMALCGMFIPAYEGSEIMFVEEIFADIGDEQSIEQSLSTFSSHIKNIVSITNNIKEKTLVLLDEVGSGTDPEEGAALAISIIEYFIKNNCKLMGTTHYSQLKTYAINSENVENASVEFDVDTLKPTYRLNVGIPGKSNAFIISKALGLNEEIIDTANNHLSGDTIKLEQVIRSLEEKNFEVLKNNREIEILREENKILNEKLKKRLDGIEKEKAKVLEEARKESETIINNAKEQVDHILKTINNLELHGVNSQGIKDLEAARREMKKKMDEENKAKEEKRKVKYSNQNKESFKAGSSAFLRRIGQEVVLLSNPDQKGDVTVQAGVLKLSVNINELEWTGDNKKSKTVHNKKDMKLRTSGMSTSINLLGMDTLQAISEVDKYLDDAFVNGLNEVSIIHGKGTGALRKSITDLLRNHVHVKSYRLGEYNEGGHGVTIAYIK